MKVLRQNADAASRAGSVRAILLAAAIGLTASGATGCGGEDAAPAERTKARAAEPEHSEPASNAGPTTVHLDSTALRMADLRLAPAESSTSGVLPVTGRITYDASRVSHVGPRTDGRIVDLRVELGSGVQRGQVLAVLESPEVGATRAELEEAVALARIARENFERERRLEAQGISSRKELLDAEVELRRAEAALQSARARLVALGGESGRGGEFTVTAPFDGLVVEKHATRGEVAGPSDELFTVADLSRLWIELDVFERDLTRIAEGQPVTVTTVAYPRRTFSGRIVYLGDVLDLETRTVRARVEVENPDGALKPGMFATARIEVGAGAPTISVPRDAVQTLDGREVVWVPGDERGEFRARPVQIGSSAEDGRVQVLSGLQAGDTVVVDGAFTLKAELSKGEFGEGHGH